METTTAISTTCKLLEIQEPDILIDFKPLSKCRSDIHLRSLQPLLPVFFKILTSTTHKFYVNPPNGSLAPLSTVTVQVILRPQPLPPCSTSDRFLVRSALTPLDLDCPADSSSLFNSIRLRVVYVGSYLLQLAISTGDSASMRLILRHQPELLPLLNQPDQNHTNPLNQSCSPVHVSVSVRDYNSLLKSIETTNSNINSFHSRDEEGRTVLHLAGERGEADKGAKSFDGRRKLHLAAANGDAEMVATLLELGADRTIGNERGRLPVNVARDKGHQDVVDILERWERIMKATRRGDLRRLESLLKKRTGITGCDQYGNTALHLAAIKGSCDVISLLIEHGMNVHITDNEGHGALHLAVESGHLDAVELLVSLGADVNVRTKRGMTALDMAVLLGYDEIECFLAIGGVTERSSGDPVSFSRSPVISSN